MAYCYKNGTKTNITSELFTHETTSGYSPQMKPYNQDNSCPIYKDIIKFFLIFFVIIFVVCY